jgi:Asp-tRNA(Asn)/Glu-tRNA(Gln) amidotransferase A subunit family amidase
VLDLNAVAVPAGTYPAKELGSVKPEEQEASAETEGELPFSITFLGAGGSDAEVLKVAEMFERVIAGGEC